METMAVTFLKKLPRILIWLCLISLFFAINYVIIDSYNSFQGHPNQSKTSDMHKSKAEAYSNASVKHKKNNIVSHDKIKDKQATKKKESQESKLQKSKPKKSEYADQLLKLTNKTPRKIIDIMGLPPIKFDQRYKNPCFIGDVDNPLFQDGRLHCLPYFYIIGVKKSGTSDFFNRIAAHPEFQTPSFKEAQWFPRLRAGVDTKFITERSDFINTIQKGIDNRSIKFYISMFDSAADGIQNCTRRRITTNKCITAEATPANLHMHTGWKLMPGNEGLTEPRYTNFHYIKHLTPDVKIIIIFRNPVSRLFSDFMHQIKLSSEHNIDEHEAANKFHHVSKTLIDEYTICFDKFSMRRCIYDEEFEKGLPQGSKYLAESFRAGFYVFYMEELLSVFEEDQLFVINMEQYLTKTRQTLKETFKFLNMSAISSRELSEILNFNVSNESKKHYDMLPKTKHLLYEFYKPYNKKMATLLKDNSFLFPER